jgi:hypothetical protein
MKKNELDPYGFKFEKLDYRVKIKCPCLKADVMMGMCRLMCKFYHLDKYGERCEYAQVER